MSEVMVEQSVTTEAGLSEALARSRAGLLRNLDYRLRFDIPAEADSPIAATVSIGFDLDKQPAPLQLDFRQDASSIRSLQVNGESVEPDLRNEHIVLPAAALRPGGNRIDIDFIAGNDSLNRNADFLYTLFVPDRARTAFPLFDQPDLKARFELSLVLPGDWLALANAPLAQRLESGDGRVEYRFFPSDPISSYLFSFVAGKFESITREVNGRPMTMLHRETDAAKVARNLDAIFELHGQSLDWLERYTRIEYPFRKFDFVLIPGFPYGGMEHVGAINYRASSLLLEEEPPLTDLLGRAQLIAHESAHMWFGNLVTMRWFDDVWTKEVFANFMADKIVNPAFAEVDHELNFLVSHYPAAYAVDRSEGANPIRQPLPNLNQAGQLYGGIIYHKAPIMMRQLELILGEEALREGLAEYLRRFSYGNASWPDLIGILDTRTDIDLAAWSDVWVNTAGRPEFRVAATGEETGPLLLQEDPAGGDRVWPQQFDLLTLDGQSRTSTTLMVASHSTPLPASFTPRLPVVNLFNANGRGYGLFPVGTELLSNWGSLQAVQKGSALVSVYDNVLAGSIVDIPAYLDLLLGIVELERDPLLLKLALGQLQYVYQSLLGDARRSASAAATEERLWATVTAQPDSSRTKLVFRVFAAMAETPAQVQQLYDIWAGTLAVDNLILEEDDLVELAQVLAIRLPAKSAAIIATQLARIDNP
ncbi:MAG: M1 family aminopeptidase, partial [Halieaceae bacterium]|nr:M1 family aminopeptidase [Halieaceae bacterium]